MPQLEVKELFKFESALCFFKSSQVLRKVEFFDGFFSANEFVFIENGLWEVFGDIVAGVVHRILGGGDQEFIFEFFSSQAFGEGVNGDEGESLAGILGIYDIEFGVGDGDFAFEVVDFSIDAIGFAGF